MVVVVDDDDAGAEDLQPQNGDDIVDDVGMVNEATACSSSSNRTAVWMVMAMVLVVSIKRNWM